MQVRMRFANASDLLWINKRYTEIGFMRSDLNREKILIAEVRNVKAGMGRVVTIDSQTLELGGIFVKEDFRNQGIATRLVHCLLNASSPKMKMYCIAFKHLTFFYQRFGFQPYQGFQELPLELQNKIKRCEKIYNNNIEFLKLLKH